MFARAPKHEQSEQGRQWSKHASKYDELFLDPFREGVENPIIPYLEKLPHRRKLTVADLGCGAGPLLPWLLDRFGQVIALDFAQGMINKAKKRLGERADQVRFLCRSMDQLDDLSGQLDVAVAYNSVVMPDVRIIDNALRAIRSALKPGGRFVGIMPAMDAIHYHTMLLYDYSLDRGDSPEEAERYASFYGEHHYYEFSFGRFRFKGLDQKFWMPFEIEHRFAKAGFVNVKLAKVLYPWDDQLVGYENFTHAPKSWDWGFIASNPA